MTSQGRSTIFRSFTFFIIVSVHTLSCFSQLFTAASNLASPLSQTDILHKILNKKGWFRGKKVLTLDLNTNRMLNSQFFLGLWSRLLLDITIRAWTSGTDTEFTEFWRTNYRFYKLREWSQIALINNFMIVSVKRKINLKSFR